MGRIHVEPPSGGPARHLLEHASAQRLEAGALRRSEDPPCGTAADASSRILVQQIPCARASSGSSNPSARFAPEGVSASRQVLALPTPAASARASDDPGEPRTEDERCQGGPSGPGEGDAAAAGLDV